MLSFLVHFIQAFIPVSLLTGMLLARHRENHGRALPATVAALTVGMLAGAAVYYFANRHGVLTSARVSLYGVATAGALICAAGFLASRSASRVVSLFSWGGSLFFLATLYAVTTFSFLGFASEQALSATTVLNTELILNIAGIIGGVSLVSLLVPLTLHLAERCGARVTGTVILFALLLLMVPWSAEIMLALMRLELVELTTLRLSYVAKVAKYAALVPYGVAMLVACLALIFFQGRPAVEAGVLAQMQKAERRKANSLLMFEMRWFKAAVGSVTVVLALLLYYDVYASRPPRISPPIELTPDAAGIIRVKTADVSDGKLHRYSFVTDDGHVVRFFMINRARGEGSRIGVVYDACMMCGDMGYLQEKNEIICIACNVRIFLPSIGKEGGCNPIPLTHRIEGGEVLVAVQDLDKGARYFSQVVAKKTKDPVTGKEVDSSKAPYQYEYQGRTYFFESAESAEKFKKSPETYIGKRESRHYRVQGYQKS